MVENLIKLSPEVMREYSPIAFWFWNAELDSAEIRRQVREMVKQGVYGGFMHPRPSMTTKYFSEKHWKLMEDTIEEAKEHGFNAWLYDEFGWPSGTAGVTDPNGSQTYSLVLRHGKKFWGKYLRIMVSETEEGQEVELGGKLNGDEDLEILAIRAVPVNDNGKPIFTEQLDLLKKAGKTWTVSSGSYLIIEVYKGYDNNIIDYLNYDAVRCFIDVTHEEYLKRFGSEFGKSIPGVFFDEIFMTRRNLPFTDGFLEKFSEEYGYDFLDYALALVHDSGPVSVKVRHDFFNLAASLYEEAFFKQVTKWCESHSLKLIGHTEEHVGLHPWRQGDFFRTMCHVTIPCSDHHGFRYSHPRAVWRHEVKLVSSAASQYGKERIAVEGFGGAGWAVTLEELKNGTNLLATLGIDCFIMHGFYYTLDIPEAAEDYPNSWFFQNPYWDDFRLYSEYVARLSYMLAGGKHVCDVGLLYPIETLWANIQTDRWSLTSDGVNATRCFEEMIGRLCDACVGFEVVNEEGLVNGHVHDGAIDVGKSSFKYIICPALAIIRRETAEALRKFVNSGGCVIFINRIPDVVKPEDMAMPVASVFEYIPELQALDKGTSVHVGAGCFIHSSAQKDAVEYICAVHKPELRVSPNAAGIQCIQKKKDGRDILFVANTHDKPGSFTVQAKCFGKVFLMYPDNGEVREIYPDETCENRDGYLLEFSRELPGHSGVFVIVQPDVAKKGCTKENCSDKAVEPVGMALKRRIPLDRTWKFSWDPAKGWRDAGKLTDYKSEVPIARFTHETYSGSRVSKTIRLDEDTTGGANVGKLLDSWDGYWISFRRAHLPNALDESPFMSFRKEINVFGELVGANIDMAAMGSWTLFINGKNIASGGGPNESQRIDLTDHLVPGSNFLVVTVSNQHPKPQWDVVWMFEGREKRLTSLLAEIELRYANGEIEHVFTDKTWEVCCTDSPFEDVSWTHAWERGRPPILPFGRVSRKEEKPLYPARVTYSVELPVTAVGYTIAARGKNVVITECDSTGCGRRVRRIDVVDGEFSTSLGEPGQGIVTVDIDMTVESEHDGLLAPVLVQNVPVETDLENWAELGLHWYSGRCVYEKSFVLNAEDLGGRVLLNLEDVRHTCRVYVNGKLAGACLWKPYVLDVGEYLKEGENILQIEVANLLANEMFWKIDRRVESFGWARYWKQDFTLKDSDRLESGLLGPVSLEIYC